MQIAPLLHPEIIMLRPSDMGYLFELINTYNLNSTSTSNYLQIFQLAKYFGRIFHLNTTSK
jgi:hypothetical protein